MTKQYPALQTDDAREYINKIREWQVAITVGINQLVSDHEVFVGTSQFYDYGFRLLLFYLGGDITIPKEIVEKYRATSGEEINIKCSPLDDGSWRAWSVPEKDDPLPENEQSESES